MPLISDKNSRLRLPFRRYQTRALKVLLGVALLGVTAPPVPAQQSWLEITDAIFQDCLSQWGRDFEKVVACKRNRERSYVKLHGGPASFSTVDNSEPEYAYLEEILKCKQQYVYDEAQVLAFEMGFRSIVLRKDAPQQDLKDEVDETLKVGLMIGVESREYQEAEGKQAAYQIIFEDSPVERDFRIHTLCGRTSLTDIPVAEGTLHIAYLKKDAQAILSQKALIAEQVDFRKRPAQGPTDELEEADRVWVRQTEQAIRDALGIPYLRIFIN